MLLKVPEDLLAIGVCDLGIHFGVLDVLVAEVIGHVLEFIPIKPWVAMASDARESYATHNRLP
jgi:hypothetical protein